MTLFAAGNALSDFAKHLPSPAQVAQVQRDWHTVSTSAHEFGFFLLCMAIGVVGAIVLVLIAEGLKRHRK